MTSSLPELAGGLVAFALTLFVFSYLLGDNLLFRFAIHILIGVAAGYVVLVSWFNVIWPHLLLPLWQGSLTFKNALLYLFPLVFSLLLLTKATRRLGRWGTPVMAFLVGVGSAAAIGGAILGTIYPQIYASINVLEPVNGPFSVGDLRLRTLNASVILISTIATLVYFQNGRKTTKDKAVAGAVWIEGLALVGKMSIAVGMGVIFAGVYVAALTALVERMHFLVTFLKPLIFP
jgi:hypothetical protein